MKIKTLFVIATMAFAFMQIHAQSLDTMAIGYTEHVNYSPAKTSFYLCAPDNGKRRPLLRLYKDGWGGKPFKTFKMKQVEDYGWTADMKGDLKGTFYTFDVAGDKKNRCETPGMFARAVGVNGKRGAVIDMRTTDPEGWAADKRPAISSPSDLVVYEMHHRDFSIDASSGLKHKGKFLALTEPRAINYLKELGVNAIHMLPSYDYASVDENRLDQAQYNWGYDPLNYNVPEGSYSTDPYQPEARIREFKQMVQALHKAGIRVILDVVYNHTFDIEGSNFQRTFPDYFYRKNEDGTYSNGSGCGNETASERPMMRRFMIESMKYWVNEYHIDGFRVDLMGVHDIETMNAIRAEIDKIDPTIYIYGEGWSAGSCAYPQEKLAVKANMRQLPRIGAFSDELRDALRGPFNDDKKGAFLAGIPGSEESVKFGIAGAIHHPQIDMTKVNYSKEAWAGEPTQMISYVSCHDDMCLTDRLRASIPGIATDEIVRLSLLAQTAVLTSQGVPFILSGEEMLRDKKGVHNSFNSPDSVNRLDWDNLLHYPQVFDYYRNLIALRKHHPAFRLGKAHLVRRHLEFLSTPPNVVAYRLKDLQGIDPWSEIIVILNANKERVDVNIPEGHYQVVACQGMINEDGVDTLSGDKAVADGQSALILCQTE